jgi:hypothetical protein
MRMVLRWAAVALVVVMSAAPAVAQTLAGSWQGSLTAGGRTLRLVFVTTADGAASRGVMYSIDQGGQGVPATITVQGSAVRMALAGINATFEGSLSADGNTLTGTFTQGGTPTALSLVRAGKDTAWAIPEPPRPMAADAPLAFEVATIKLSNPDTPGKLFTVRGRQVLTINTTLNDLIVPPGSPASRSCAA